jgi:antitoxin PrlF
MTLSAIATMTSKGQLTVPKAIREALGLRDGTQVRFEVDTAHGTAALEPVKYRMEDLWAFAVSGTRRMSLQEMEEAIQREARR